MSARPSSPATPQSVAPRQQKASGPEDRVLQTVQRRGTRPPANRKKAPPPPEARPADARERWLRSTRRRLVAVAFAPVALLVASASVAGYLQLEKHDVFLREAQRNYLRSVTLDDTRGPILDRNGAMLASSVDVDTVYVDPKNVKEPTVTAARLAEALELPYADVYERVTRKKRFVYVKRRISEDESRRVRSLGLAGVYLSPEGRRFYPRKELAGQVIGIVSGEHAGIEGIELAEDTTMRGQTAKIPALRDALGRTAFLEPLPAVPRFAGNMVVLSIDEKIQSHAEMVLEKAVVSARALSGMAVVMDVHTGELLALAHVPRFNPNNYADIKQDRRRNRAITDVFEPGSIFKVFTLAAALDKKVVRLEDVIDTEHGHWKIGSHTIHDTHPTASLTVRDVLKFSSNIGFGKIGQLVGKDDLFKYLRALGIGERPGTGFPGEASGYLGNPKNWAQVTFANICFGQGVSVSAVQMVRAMAAIANGGKLMKPLLVLEVRDSNGTVLHRNTPQVERQALPAATARQVLDALAAVVEEGGTGRPAYSERFPFVGKTGTAQKPDTLVGGYSSDGWIGTFLGVAPADDPQLAIIVVIDEPMGKGYGGVVAAPPFKEIAEWTLDYRGTRPKGDPVRRSARVRAGTGAAIALGSAAPAATAPTEAAPAPAREGQDTALVPNFRGHTMTRVRDLARDAGVQVVFEGTGAATTQSVPAGARVPLYAPIEVRFAPPALVPVP